MSEGLHTSFHFSRSNAVTGFLHLSDPWLNILGKSVLDHNPPYTKITAQKPGRIEYTNSEELVFLNL